MFRPIIAFICIIGLVCGGTPSLYAQDEELGEIDLLLDPGDQLRPGAETVEKSGAERLMGAAPVEETVKLAEGEGKKVEVILVDGRIVAKAQEAVAQPEAVQRLDALQAGRQTAQQKVPYTITGEMSRPKKEGAMVQK